MKFRELGCNWRILLIKTYQFACLSKSSCNKKGLNTITKIKNVMKTLHLCEVSNMTYFRKDQALFEHILVCLQSDTFKWF